MGMAENRLHLPCEGFRVFLGRFRSVLISLVDRTSGNLQPCRQRRSHPKRQHQMAPRFAIDTAIWVILPKIALSLLKIRQVHHLKQKDKSFTYLGNYSKSVSNPSHRPASWATTYTTTVFYPHFYRIAFSFRTNILKPC